MKRKLIVDTGQSTPRERVNQQAICDHQEEGRKRAKPAYSASDPAYFNSHFCFSFFNSTIKNTFMEN